MAVMRESLMADNSVATKVEKLECPKVVTRVDLTVE